MNPVAENPLSDRADFERAVQQLVDPLVTHRSDGCARIRPTATGAQFPDVSAELEGVSRPLWGIVPLGVHGSFEGWEQFRRGLVNGTDRAHAEYWGEPDDYSQKLVEMAAIGVGLAYTPERLWEPLSSNEQSRLAEWLHRINTVSLHDNNWLFFRVMVNAGLRSVGARHDWTTTQADLDRLESFYERDGWYTDGPAAEGGAVDYYLPWAMHFYGLLYADIAGGDDPERAKRFRDRACAFATEYSRWFDRQGRALAFGRSLTYRFAQAAFWGALTLCENPRLDWDVLRGLWARNVRWWLRQPIFTDGGVLSVGYRYPTLKPSEPYNSPNSPYWAMKAFVPLLVADDHPFWQADEAPLPEHPPVHSQPVARKVICRDGAHLFALSGGQKSIYAREKYSKFAYSTEFGFSVASRRIGAGNAGHDSAIALSLDGDQYVIQDPDETELSGTTIRTRWHPWEGVTVDSWLTPALPGHVRIHRVRTNRSLHAEEGGFAIHKTGDDTDDFKRETTATTARTTAPSGVSQLTDLFGERATTIVDQEPNTNLMHGRTVVPTLRGTVDAGEHWLATAVLASPNEKSVWEHQPAVRRTDSGVVVTFDGTTLFECSPD
ncbi:DUF2264 domain-containing protein [Halocatena halophila]|uniref:DUF2264 domain-containing protein n=1 Tax=Halocatena halophila TaxID=2814576 RepID=UPI002ED43BF1